MISMKPSRLVSVASFAMCLLATLCSLAQAQTAARPTVDRIELSFKRDARDLDSFRGVGLWSTAPTFTGAAAQDTVEIRAEGIDASGRASRISPEWVSSNPDVATVSPDKGDDVQVKVHKEGESRLKVTYQGLTKELVIVAQKSGALMMFRIAPPAPPVLNAAAPIDPALKGPKEQLSYAAGVRLAKTLRAQSHEVDADLVAQAIKDVQAGGRTLMNDDAVQATLTGVATELNVTEAVVERKKAADRNKEVAEAFLAENAKKDGVVALPSGLQYKIIREGKGRKPTGLDVAVCQYTGSLSDGTVFDDSRKKKDGAPVSFPVKAVIKGWQEALRLMPEGSEWQIFVPPDLAYGERGVPQGKIPPNAALVFDVELVAVRGPNDAPTPQEKAQKASLTPEQLEALKNLIRTQKIESEPKTETAQ
jgi:FKBP-type peptidyl-prolyl cis-trans isomerase